MRFFRTGCIAGTGMIWCMVLSVILCGCGQKAKMNERISLWRNDKNPYGTYIAKEWLAELFPAAEISSVKKAPEINAYEVMLQKNDSAAGGSNKLRVIISPQVMPDSTEWQNILQDITSGTDYFISTFNLVKQICDSVRLDVSEDLSQFGRDSMSLEIFDQQQWDYMSFQYPGRNYGKYFSRFDSSITNILGKDINGKANFIRIDYINGGSLFLHLSPLAFSNFFLLHKQNHLYMEDAFAWVSPAIKKVEWDDYFRNRDGSASSFSALQVILDNSSLRSALWVVLLIFALIYLFETRRKQSVIPERPVIKNSALEFTETVSALYLQQEDHKNLSQKMIAQFGEHIYRRYFIRFSFSDPGFIARLSSKTGIDHAFLENMLYQMRMAKDYPQVGSAQLQELHHALQEFYKYEQHG